jgi:hypothetical protein
VLLAALFSAFAVSGIVLVAWLIVGVMAGVLQYLGNTTAAAAPNRRTAFAIRMAASALAGASLMAWLQLSQARIADYQSVCLQFVLAFLALSAVGLLLYRSEAASGVSAKGAAPPTSAVGIRGGLIVLFVLFVGQQGLGALLMQGASERALALDQIVWTMCASKLLGAAALLFGNPRNARAGVVELLLSGVTVAVGALCIGVGASTVVYACGLVLWEVALNVLSARYQAFLAYTNPVAAGMWITAAIFLGAAAGHALGPNAAASGHLALFVGFAVLTALAPSAWAVFVSRPKPVKIVRHAADV